MSLGWLTESSILPKKPKEIEDVGKASMLEMRAAFYQTESAARQPDGPASAALKQQRQRRANRKDPLAAASNRGLAERDAAAEKQRRDDELRAAQAMAHKVAMYEAMASGKLPEEVGDARGRSSRSLAASASSLVDFELKQLRSDGDLMRASAARPVDGVHHTSAGYGEEGKRGCSLTSSSMRREEERLQWEKAAMHEIEHTAMHEAGPKRSHEEISRVTSAARALSSDQRAKRQRALEERRAILRLKQEARSRVQEGAEALSSHTDVGDVAETKPPCDSGEIGFAPAMSPPADPLSQTAQPPPVPPPAENYQLRVPSQSMSAHTCTQPFCHPNTSHLDPHGVHPHNANLSAHAHHAANPYYSLIPKSIERVAAGPAERPAEAALQKAHGGPQDYSRPTPPWLLASSHIPTLSPTSAPAPSNVGGDEEMMRAMGLPSSFTSTAQVEAQAIAEEEEHAKAQQSWASSTHVGQSFAGAPTSHDYTRIGLPRYGHAPQMYYQYPNP